MLANTELDGRMDREGIVKEKEEQMRDLWDFFHMQGVGSYLAGLDGEDVRREGDAPGTCRKWQPPQVRFMQETAAAQVR
jgi:hypothetical protein